MTTDSTRKPHHGRNLKHVRDLFGISQEALAEKLGLEWNQKRVSLLEGKEEIDEEQLGEIARVLNVPVDAIKQYDPERMIAIVQNNYAGSNNQGTVSGITNNNCNINSIDELKEAYQKSQELSDRVINELELRIKEKDETIAMLQRMIAMLEKK